jgi:hypothetical protein
MEWRTGSFDEGDILCCGDLVHRVLDIKIEYDYNKSIYSTSDDDDEDNVSVLFNEKRY